MTIDDPWNLEPTVASLEQLSTRVTARVVFDEGQRAAGYLPLVSAIHRVAGVMGEILDSYFVKDVTTGQYVARAREYVDTLGSSVDIWEVGNEVNGEWLGTSADVAAKMIGAYKVAKSSGKQTAITLYYNQGCWDSPDHEMFAWAVANIPADMKAGVDLVLVSYYEDDCNDAQPEWSSVFKRLGTMFPSARLGIGECGTDVESRKAPYLARYYTMSIDHPRYVGGYFWWHFSRDMVPRTKGLWKTLDQLIAGHPT